MKLIEWLWLHWPTQLISKSHEIQSHVAILLFFNPPRLNVTSVKRMCRLRLAQDRQADILKQLPADT